MPTSIENEYLWPYRHELERVHSAMPKLADSSKRQMAKNKAATVSPEGADCLLAHFNATVNKDKALAAGIAVDDYSASIGKRIVVGMAAINREVLGTATPEQVQASKWDARAAADAVADRAEAQDEPPDLPDIHRPTNAQAADLLRRYTLWADAHDDMPMDRDLAHWTGWSRHTWKTTRDKASKLGYQFKSDKGGVTVTGRPVKQVATDDDRIKRLEQRVETLLRELGRK